jgi:hypothetical protein
MVQGECEFRIKMKIAITGTGYLELLNAVLFTHYYVDIAANLYNQDLFWSRLDKSII